MAALLAQAPTMTIHCSLRSVFNRVVLRRSACAPLRLQKKALVAQPQRQRGVQTQALALPALVPIVARCVTAGVLFYASMNWVYYRGFRKDAEKELGDYQKKEETRREKLDKLTSGKVSDDDTKNNK